MQLTEQLLGHELGIGGDTLQQKDGHDDRQLQIVRHDSCIDCECSIVVQQCAGQDDWHIMWQ